MIVLMEFRSIRCEKVTVVILNNVNPVAVFGYSLRLGKNKLSTIKTRTFPLKTGNGMTGLLL